MQWNVVRVKKIAAKNNRVIRRKHGMYPTGGQKYRAAFLDLKPIAVLHLIAKKYLAMILSGEPILVNVQILLGWLDQIEHLVALQINDQRLKTTC